MNEEGSCAVVVRFLEPIIDGTPGSEALGENCVSDQVWLTKSLCVVEAVVVAVVVFSVCEITVVALTHKVAHAKSSVKNTGDHQP
jgi:hypothetical protein